MMRGRNVLVFDLDGTLVDSAPDLRGALNAMLAERGQPAISLDDVRAAVGDGVVALVRRATARAGAPAEESALPGLVERFLDRYAATRHAATRPYPGVPGTLAELRRRGHRLAICTNKPIELTRDLLDVLGLAHLFDAVTGGDSLPVRKPHPGHLTGTLDLLGARISDAAMIGDSANDVAVARSAGVPVAVVTYGYTRVPAAELGADLVLERFADLVGALEP